MKSAEIRKTFLDFFVSKQHTVVPSAPMVIKNDPTLMFTNAGMNQFKDIFLGNIPAKHPRIADTQKCLRVSGKHNDLEEVGHDTYHHTMFEMLGNWSFGDTANPEAGYFKKEAIEWAWELLHEVYGIPAESLYVTVFGGDSGDKLAEDSEAYNYWRKIVPEHQILYGIKKDNFWEMGETGPCGPCSEIHVDLRPESEKKALAGRELVNKGNPLVIEIWNLVFIEFNRKADGSLEPLPAKHVDTGMGFERLCMVLQGVTSNYDTDVFQPLINQISVLARCPYGQDPSSDTAMRVVADHLRAIAFAIADGQLPSNNKAGYVIRRILRRAVRYGFTFLGFREPFIHALVPLLADQKGDVFPELIAQKDLIMKVIAEEEQAFLRTLETGISRFESYKPKNKVIDGRFAFELFDTFGFPVDLTQLMAREKGCEVDMGSFNLCMTEQKERSRQAAAVEKDDWITVHPCSKESVFTGYDRLSEKVKICRYRKVKSRDKEFVHIILDKTPFYAESGGQVGDKGVLFNENIRINIVNTLKENNLVIHVAEQLPEDLKPEYTAEVDEEKRKLTAANHSATHLLHAALRSILGGHIEQKGSLVDEERLRFDFSHFAKMSGEEIRKTEILVNQKIFENLPLIEHRSITMDAAKEMGAIALFGEKYGDEVRVIGFGDGFSVELCGGTHMQASGNIGLFRIVGESSVAAGVRRIEAVTGLRALNSLYEYADQAEMLKHMLKGSKDIVKAVGDLCEENDKMQKQLEELMNEKYASMAAKLTANAEKLAGVDFVAYNCDLDQAAVKNLVYEARKLSDSLFMLVGTHENDKAYLTLMIADKLVETKGWDASKIIRELAVEIQGGGGGQKYFATAGGKKYDGIQKAFEKAKAMLAKTDGQ